MCHARHKEGEKQNELGFGVRAPFIIQLALSIFTLGRK